MTAFETAKTVPALPSFPPRGKSAGIAGAGVTGVGAITAAIWYLLSCVQTQGEHLQDVEKQMSKVETKVDAVRPVLHELKEGQRDMRKEMSGMNKAVGRIEGYIVTQRNGRRHR